MNFFKKIFSTKNPLDSLRKAVLQERWADALVENEIAKRDAMTADELAEFDSLLATAGNALAEINLAEGEAFLRVGDTVRAREHFSLAASQAHDPGVQEKAREQLTAPVAAGSSALSTKAACCPTGCSAPAPVGIAEALVGNLDAQAHLDLLLSAYPPELAERYANIEGPFLDAFLCAHQGDEAAALAYFEQVSVAERNDLFHFERGSLLARAEKMEAAAADLERAVAINPHLDVARQMQVTIDFALGREREAQERLRQMIHQGKSLAFAHGQFAASLVRGGNEQQGLEHALRALEYGADPETFHLAATLLERTGRLDEAEGCLAHLATPGCGSVNPPLAEFWLRHRKNPDRALEIFKGALRREPGNCRWRLRIAQAYLARGWRKQSATLLNQLLDDPALEPHFREEAVAAMEQCR
ncbi:MAG: tetratricopeptide repeat protein [Desulfuromonadales bacterium]